MITKAAADPFPKAEPPIALRPAVTPSDREAVAHLRYGVYVAELGRQQPFADHAARTIHEPMDRDGLVLGAFLPDGTAIGTVRLNAANDPTVICSEFYGWRERERSAPGQVAFATKFVLAPDHRGTTLALHLMRRLYRTCLQRGYWYVWLDANDHLVTLYERMGFRALRDREHPLYGHVTIMELDLLDTEHLRACRSPLLRDALAFLARTNQAA